MRTFVKPSVILEKLELAMQIALTLEDPLTKKPITIAYDNLHSLIVMDVSNLMFESQVVANLYAEMGRFQRAAEYAAGVAEVRYRKWKAGLGDELRAKRSAAKDKPPTVAMIEEYYRDHPLYEEKSSEGERFKAIAGFFEDLKWSFRMKSEHMKDASRTLSGFERTVGNEDSATEAGESEGHEHSRSTHARLSDYQTMADEAAAIVASSGSSDAAIALLSGMSPETPPARQARPLEG